MRKTWCLYAVVTSVAVFGTLARPSGAARADLTHLNRQFLLTAGEAQQWHAAKDSMGPALSGSPSWKNFMSIVEARLREYGAVDVTRNAWTYDRWSTTQWPDDSKWSLTSDGRKV